MLYYFIYVNLHITIYIYIYIISGTFWTWSSVARRLAWPNQTQKWPFRALLDHQRSEAGLCPGTDYLYHLLQHNAHTGHKNHDRDGIYIRYRLDGSLFNLRRLQVHTKTLKQLIWELSFAKYTAFVAYAKEFCSASLSASQRLPSS